MLQKAISVNKNTLYIYTGEIRKNSIMGLEKVAFNFMVERGGKFARSLLCYKPIPKPINFKGLKYAPALEKDTVQLFKTIGKHKIKPIINDEEYHTVLQRLLQKEEWGDNLYGWYKNPLISWQNIKNYHTCKDIEKGVIAYAGYDDIHIALNRYLSGRTLPDGFNKQMGEDFTKLVDYSLKKMDKTFPPYNGITYRFGFFDPKVKQYYSTSKSPRTFPYGNKDGQHTMFVSKRGHDIEAFQKAKNTSASRQRFIDEHEVLMDVSADYRELVDLTPELLEKRLEYAKTILAERKERLTEENIQKIISQIKVYEEI